MTPTARRSNRFVHAAVRRLPQNLVRLVRGARRRDVPLLAASLAFYGTVSIVPAVILVLSVLALVLGDRRVHDLARELRTVAPEGLGADELLRRVADLGTSLGLWAVVAALWPATSYGAGLTRAFHELSPRRSERPKPLRGRGLTLIVVFPVLVIGGLVGSFAGFAFLGDGGIAAIAGWALALVAGFVGAAVAVALILRIFPPIRLAWRAIAVGTAVAAGGVSLISLAFTLYVSLGANFQQHYATSGLAGVVLLAVWLFLSNVFLLVGFQAALEV